MNITSLKNFFTQNGGMQFKEHRDIVRGIGADSMVLLKNKDFLPMNRGRVALFGAGAVDTLFCGIFFNYVFTDGNINVRSGLLNNGFTFSTDSWLSKMEKAVKQNDKQEKNSDKERHAYEGRRCNTPEIPISKADLAESILGTNTCIYVLRHGITTSGMVTEEEYQLSETEKANLQMIVDSFENVVLVLNSNMVELAQIARVKNIKAIILMGLAGMEAGNSLTDVLTGAVNPSGRLTATWAKKFKDYSTCYTPAVISRNSQNNEIDYKEGIFVGYRYFDAFDVAPLYPFGYGLSYTSFDMKLEYLEASWMVVALRIKVTNTGNHAGRQVVQVYCSQPEGSIEKPYQILVGFGKTGKLKPGEWEDVTIKIPIMPLCSFDEETTAWVMEKGDYLFRIGENSRDTVLSGKVVLDRTTIIKRVAKVMEPTKKLEFLAPPKRKEEEAGYILAASLSGDDYNSENKFVELKTDVTTYVPEGSNYVSYINENAYTMPAKTHEKVSYVKPCGSSTFFDVIKGKVTMEEFVSSLSPEIMARIVVGAVNESKVDSESRFNFNFNIDRKKLGISSRATSQFSTTLGIPGVNIADGPSGLRIEGVPCTCFPAPINMAQTWDMGSMVRMGRAYGREMEYYDIDYTLAPDLNIHRNPMRSRAYEFYSEDPALAGIMGAGFIMGVKRYEGRNVILKNLATYNQESGEADVNINVSRQAFGEIYLRSFSACQSTIRPAGLLNSGNRLNGLYSSSQRGLNTDIVRSDWGFNGLIMSDWGSLSEKAYDLHAGCDLIMPGFDPDKILEAMMEAAPVFGEDGYVTLVQMAYAYGEPMIRYENWGSFMPDKKGKDFVSTTVATNVALNPKVLKMEKQGLCKIDENPDGSKSITYKGINRGAYLSLGDLQQAVIHILSELKNTAAMKRLMENAKI
ncbi:MAG: glycoside hydrolase family 3 protein [Pseudobutyrivibrio sp.]|nr:glycoside hydrolase family 3 protein [Pseudobutyrivibrio sp.]